MRTWKRDLVCSAVMLALTAVFLLMQGCQITVPPIPTPPAPTPVPAPVVTNTPPVPTPTPVVVNSNDAFTLTSYASDAGTMQIANLKQTCTITWWTLKPGSLTVGWEDTWPGSPIQGSLVWCWQDGSGVWQGQYVEWRGGVSPYEFVGPFTDTYIHQYKAGDAFGFLFVSKDHTQRSETVQGVWNQ